MTPKNGGNADLQRRLGPYIFISAHLKEGV